MPKEEDDMDEEEDADRVHAMKILKKSLREYFERVAERNRRIKEEVSLIKTKRTVFKYIYLHD